MEQAFAPPPGYAPESEAPVQFKPPDGYVAASESPAPMTPPPGYEPVKSIPDVAPLPAHRTITPAEPLTHTPSPGLSGQGFSHLQPAEPEAQPDIAEAAQEPLSKKILGMSLSDAVDALEPKAKTPEELAAMPADERIRAQTNRVGPDTFGGEAIRRTAKGAAGVLDFMQSPEGLAAAIAETASGGSATPVIAMLLGAQFGTQGGKQAVRALNDISKNGVNPENTEALGNGLTMALLGVIGPLGMHEADSKAKAIADAALANKPKIEELLKKTEAPAAEPPAPFTPPAGYTLETPAAQPAIPFSEPSEPESANPPIVQPESVTPTLEATPEIPTEQPQPEAPAEKPTVEPVAEPEAPTGQPEQAELGNPEASEVPKSADSNNTHINTHLNTPLAPAEFAADYDEIRSHPARGSASQTFTGTDYARPLFEQRLKDAAQNATPEVLGDYLGKLQDAADTHMPGDAALARDIERAKNALTDGNRGSFALAADDARARLGSASQEAFSAQQARNGGFYEEYAATHAANGEPPPKLHPEETPEFEDDVNNRAQYLFREWVDSARESRDSQKAYIDQGRHGQDLNYDAQVTQDERFKDATTPGSSGVKEGSPLEGIAEGPQQLMDAADKGSGKLYEKAMERYRDWVRENEGDQIREHLASTSEPEDSMAQGEGDDDLSFDFGKDEPGFSEHIQSKIDETREEIRRLTREAAAGSRPGAVGAGDLALAYVKLGAYHLAKGIVDFKDWSEKMIEDLGEKIRPQLRDIYSRAIERLRAAKDAGLSGGKLDAALERELSSKYVKNEPFDFKLGKDDKATGKELRQEYAGLKNSRIVRVAQLADEIRRAIPDKTTREALAWYKDALAKSPKDPLSVIRTAITDDRFKDYKAQLEKALTLTPQQITVLDKVGQYYAEAGRISRQLGTIGTVRDEYQNRIYAAAPPQDFVKTEMSGGLRPTTSHAKARTFDTMFDAVQDPEMQKRYGGKGPFAITDIADALEVHGREMARVNTSHQLADALSNKGVGKWVDPKRIPKDWQPVEGLSRRIPLKDEDGEPVISKKTGNQLVANHVFAAPKGIVDAIRPITDSDKFGSIPVVKALQKYQGLVKTVDLSYSLFHHFTMAMQAIYQGNYKGLIDLPHLSKVLNTPAFREMETDFVRNGGMTATVEANHDILRDLVKKEPGTFSKIANLPIVKQALELSDRNTNFLFGKMQRMLKVQDYAGKVADWLGKHPDATPEEMVAAKRGIARQNNAAYGGLNWEAMGMTKTNLSLLRTALLAPDWTISNGELVTQAFKKGPEGTAARAHYIRAAIAGMVLTEGISKLLTGHTTDKNPPGHKLEVQIAPGVWVSFFRGGIGDAIKYWSNLEQNGSLKGSFQFAQSKLAPLPRTLVGGLSGTEYSGVPISRSKTVLGKEADYASYIARSAGPVPFGVGNLAKYAEDPNKTAVGAAGVSSGIARYAPANKTATIHSFASPATMAALDEAKKSFGPGKPHDQADTGIVETPRVSAIRAELVGKIIENNVSRLIANKDSWDRKSDGDKKKELAKAVRDAHTEENSYSKRKWPAETSEMIELRRQVGIADQRAAMRSKP